MSISICVAAQRRLSVDDFEYISLYNGLLDKGIDVPDKMRAYLEKILGEDSFWCGEEITQSDDTIEINMRGSGNAMYGEGMIIDIADLPPNTIALRIYASI